MGDLFDSKLQKALDPIKSWLKDLETGPNAWAQEYGFHDDIGNVGIKMGLDNDATLKQQQLLAAQQHARTWEDEQNKLAWGGRIDNEGPYMDTDEAHREQEELEQRYTQPLDLTDDELALIHHSEENEPAQPTTKYIPGLIRLGTRPNPTQPRPGDRRSQPLIMDDSPPQTQTYATAATKTPAGSKWKIVGKKVKPAQATPTTQGPAPPTIPTKAWGFDKLSAKGTTKAAIIAHAEAVFAKKLSTRMDKTKLINAYLQLVHGISNVDITKTNIVDRTPQESKQSDVHRETCKHTSEWTIKRMAGTERINFNKPFNGDPLKLTQHLQTSLRQHSALPEPPLTLVSG